MFTGIVQAVGTIQRAEQRAGSLRLEIEKPRGWKLKPGDSVATDGVCLTVAAVKPRSWTVMLMPETLAKTTFGKQTLARVNLELALRLSDRLDGHIVQGHVDAVGTVVSVERRRGAYILRVSFSKKFQRLVVPKGSITLDGVSLTVVDVGRGWLTVALVDFTLMHTTLGEKKKGDLVNIEFDILAKYILSGSRTLFRRRRIRLWRKGAFVRRLKPAATVYYDECYGPTQ